MIPTFGPTPSPTDAPSDSPSLTPSVNPTTDEPTSGPTVLPTPLPTPAPSPLHAEEPEFFNEGAGCETECYDNTLRKWTTCPNICGVCGICCRQGATNQLDACGSLGGIGGHVCTLNPYCTALPTPSPTSPPSPLHVEEPEFFNEGAGCEMECYDNTLRKWTTCPNICGVCGICCRQGATNQLDACGSLGGIGGHVCTLNPYCTALPTPSPTSPPSPLHVGTIKKTTVRRIFKRLSEALENTSNQIRKATDRLKRLTEKGMNYDDDAMTEVEWLNENSQNRDWDSWINEAMVRIVSFRDSYADDGEPRRGIISNGKDAMDKGVMAKLIRLSSKAHLKGMKAESARLMDRIYDQILDNNRGSLYNSARRSNTPASTWLVEAAALYKALAEDYNFNG